MSTRAILGIVQNDGSFLGAWQWNDGGNILELLNRKFVDDIYVKKLLSVGMWSCMFGIKGYKEHLQFTVNNFGENSIPANKVKSAVKLENNVYFIKDQHHFDKPKVYKSVIEALNEDVNYVYVYFPHLHRWRKYRYSNLNALKRDGLV